MLRKSNPQVNRRSSEKKLTDRPSISLCPHMNPMSLRKRRAVIDKISAIQVANIRSPDRKRIFDIYEEYLDSAVFTEDQIATFHAILDQRLITNVSEYVEPRMAAKTLRVVEVEELIEKQPFPDVRDLLWSLLDTWTLRHIGPVVDLAELVNDDQNIHTRDVLKKTTDGVLLLGKVSVPKGQKTLVEVEAELRRLLSPVKCKTGEEMFAYLSSHIEKYAVYPEELKKLLREAYVEACEFKKEYVNRRIYIVSNNPNESNWYTNVVNYKAEKKPYTPEDASDTDDTEVNESEDEAVKAELIAVVEDEAVVEAKADAQAKADAEAKIKDKDILAYFARGACPPTEANRMLYSTYYKEYYEEYYAIDSKIKDTIHDMREWGNRSSVMKKDENLYKSTLRGLWAKIKGFEPEIRDELIKRLFEEASEAVGLCADGHVGRLCNVLVGFDPEFTSSLSPMEYFQNNIALIAENIHAPHESKLIQAKSLMDEVGMPEKERAAWFDAL